MKVGILGLGLIGGSLARAYALAGHTVYAIQRNQSMLSFAMLAGAVHGKLNEETIPECDLILLSIYPDGSASWLERNAHLVSKDALVIDCCGVKERICGRCFPLAEQYGFTFMGGHPMAGTQYSGYKHSRANLCKGAPMVIVPPRFDDITLFDKIKQLLSPACFGKFSFSSAEEHDKMIAFTSQLAHVVSNAYIKSPTAKAHKGFSAGSYKDMTRVAWLNESMWTELFFENKEPLLFEIDGIISSLKEYREALMADDKEQMRALLRDGRIAKEDTDG